MVSLFLPRPVATSSTHQLKKSTLLSTPNHPFSTLLHKSSKFPYFSTKITPHQKIIPYRTPYRQIPYFTALFRPFSHKNHLKFFTNSLSHPNFLPYIKAFLRCTIFTSKITIQLSNTKFQTFNQRITIYPTK